MNDDENYSIRKCASQKKNTRLHWWWIENEKCPSIFVSLSCFRPCMKLIAEIWMCTRILFIILNDMNLNMHYTIFTKYHHAHSGHSAVYGNPAQCNAFAGKYIYHLFVFKTNCYLKWTVMDSMSVSDAYAETIAKQRTFIQSTDRSLVEIA